MQYELKNNHLKIKVNKKGAELTSLKNIVNGIEHLWQADPQVWGRHAPILFPIVGQVENNTYKIGDNSFELSQHGFARDMNFKVYTQSENMVELVLTSNAATLKKYPYQFELYVKYEIKNTTLNISYKVINTDSKEIFFSIGAHPGFSCPFNDDSFEDYYLEFEKEETADRIEFEDGLLNGRKSNFLIDEKIILCSSDMFNDDAIIFKSLKSDWVKLKSQKHPHELQFTFKGFPYLAFWSKPKANAPYICIEPWFGIADTKEANLDFKDKQGVEKLSVNEAFNCNYSITIS